MAETLFLKGLPKLLTYPCQAPHFPSSITSRSSLYSHQSLSPLLLSPAHQASGEDPPGGERWARQTPHQRQAAPRDPQKALQGICRHVVTSSTSVPMHASNHPFCGWGILWRYARGVSPCSPGGPGSSGVRLGVQQRRGPPAEDAARNGGRGSPVVMISNETKKRKWL